MRKNITNYRDCEITKTKQTQRWEHQEILDTYNKNLATSESKALIKKKEVQ